MTVGPVRHRHHARLMTSNERHGLFQLPRILADPAIVPSQVVAPGRAQYLARRLTLRQPLVDGSVAAHLARSQVAEPHGQPERRMPGNRAAETDLDIVRMRPEHKQIDRHDDVPGYPVA